MTTSHVPQPATPRVAPSVPAALVLYAGYLALFFTTWIVNDVDYMTIGQTAESARLHYALPTLIGSAFLAVMLTVFGWWRITLFDHQRSGPRWAWLGPLCMFAISASAFILMRGEGATPALVLWCVLGVLGQLVMTFLFGSLLYAARRLSGTLLLPMFLHGLWDTSLFLPRATGSDLNLWAFAVYPVAVACALAVVRRQRGLRLGGPAG